jgi:hypothetical protein
MCVYVYIYIYTYIHTHTYYCCVFFVSQQSNSSAGRLTVEVFRSHTKPHTHPVGDLCTSDQLVVEAATYITQNKHIRRISMSSAGFEPAIRAVKRLQPYALDRAATGIGLLMCCWYCCGNEQLTSVFRIYRLKGTVNNLRTVTLNARRTAEVARGAARSCVRDNRKGQMSMRSDNDGDWVRVTRGGGVHLLGQMTK